MKIYIVHADDTALHTTTNPVHAEWLCDNIWADILGTKPDDPEFDTEREHYIMTHRDDDCPKILEVDARQILMLIANGVRQ